MVPLSLDVVKPILDAGYAPHPDGSFRIIPISATISPDQKIILHRLNGFGSLYYLLKIVLGRNKLTHGFHLPLCRQLERTHLKDLWEIPRDHFKSTTCGEGLPIWWALPFMPYDADNLRLLGYGDEFVIFMTLMHDTCTRTLLISYNITNAAKLGSKIRWHFESNAAYRAIYPESLPTTKETWSNYSLQVKRNGLGSAAGHGEGTFDFLGVGSALQSRHYIRIIQDDLVGPKTVESQSLMDKTIDYHKLVVGAYESVGADNMNDEIVIGNRWSYHDLNSYIRENEPWFKINSHSAIGGCCPDHPIGEPILPTEFSIAKLAHRKRSLGSYLFSCQYENNPCAPEDADFQQEWLRYYDLKTMPDGHKRITHEVFDGIVRKDIDINHVAKVEITDPAHAGNASANRCRHAVLIVGISDDSNYYLLDCFAKSGSYDMYFNAIYKMADEWKIYKLGVETVAAQRYIAYHINYRNSLSGRRLKIVELKGEVEGPDGTITRKKEFRIRNVLLPIFEQGRFWCQRRHADFIGEYTSFPKGRFCDILDALAYAPQVLRGVSYSKDMPRWAEQNAQRLREVNKPYSVSAMLQ